MSSVLYTQIHTSFMNYCNLLDMALIFLYNIDMSEIDRIDEKITKLLDKRKEYEEMRRLRYQGWTLQQIADKYQVSRQRVYQIVGKKNGKKAQR